MLKPPETVEAGRGVALEDLADVLRRAHLRLAGEIEWRSIGGRERACVVLEGDPAAPPLEPLEG